MCGFVGYLTLNRSAAAKGAVANLTEKSRRVALKTIERRGPDAEGPLWLLTWDLEQASTRTVYTPHQVDGAGEYWLHRALLPGEYHLEVTLGGELRTFPFSVSAGGAADVFLEP